MLQRQKRKILLCKRDMTRKDVEIFDEPYSLWIDVTDMSNEYLIEAIGNLDKDYKIAKVSNLTAKQFSTGDRCYIDKEPDSDRDAQCLDADYIVKSKKRIGAVTEIMFEGLL